MSGGHGFHGSWVEYGFFLLLLIGFLFSLGAPNAVLSYLILIVMGLAFGRLIYLKYHQLIFPYFAIAVGFLLGYIIGNRYQSWPTVIIVFGLSAYFGYLIHKKKLLKGGFGIEK
ncbi:hypothetical protein HYU13_03365 [Candidatus Woesearchaeota archaeon]|nr:hypothetical protein [Candidatus Woesearchaeota archaeon]